MGEPNSGYIEVLLDPHNQKLLKDRRVNHRFADTVQYLDNWYAKHGQFTDEVKKEATLYLRLGSWYFAKARDNGLTLVESAQHFNRAFHYYLNALYLKQSIAACIYHLQLIQRALWSIKQQMFTRILQLLPELKQQALWQSLIKGSELNTIFSSQRGLFKKPSLNRGFFGLIIAELRKNAFAGLTDEIEAAIKKDTVLMAVLKKAAPELYFRINPPATVIEMISFNPPTTPIAKPMAAINHSKQYTPPLNWRVIALKYHR